MRFYIFSSRRWRFVGWVTAIVFSVLLVYSIVQLYSALAGGGA